MAFYHPDLLYEVIIYNVPNQSGLSQITYLKKAFKGISGDYFSMLDVINSKKCVN